MREWERERGLHDTKMHYFEAMNEGNSWEYSWEFFDPNLLYLLSKNPQHIGVLELEVCLFHGVTAQSNGDSFSTGTRCKLHNLSLGSFCPIMFTILDFILVLYVYHFVSVSFI